MPKEAVTYTNLVEVFVNEFIAATNNPSLSHLTHLSRAMLHRVHSIPNPPHPQSPEITKHQGQEPISQKKNSIGRGNMDHNEVNIGVAYLWRKFHSIDDARKIQKKTHIIKNFFKLKYCELKHFQELAGNLKHASFVITRGNGLFLSIYREMKTTEDYVKITL